MTSTTSFWTTAPRLLYAAVLLCLCAGAYAQQPARRPELPPAEYDRPYTGHLIEDTYERVDAIRYHCLQPESKLIACAFPAKIVCHIILPSRDLAWRRGYRLPDIRRHEIAHCNGWKHK